MKRIRNNSGAVTGSLALGVALGCVVATPLRAQFSGPALTLSQQPSLVQTPTTDEKVLDQLPQDVPIIQGDVLSVHLFGSQEYMPTVKVASDGTVPLPLIGNVPVGGLSIDKAEELIAKRLSDAGMYKEPQVTIQVTDSANQYATVAGEMRAVVPLIGVRRLLDVLSLAGSPTNYTGFGGGNGPFPPTASHVITIIRQGEPKPIVVDLGIDPARSGKANIVIQPHDLIIVARVGVVYVVGAFQKQGAIPLDQDSPLTLLQATSLSGGPGFEGRYEDLRIIRTQGMTRTMVKVDLKRIEMGRDPDPVLQADDIVFLPTNVLKAALKSGGIGVLTNIISLALIADGR
jgi:polysaccharide export outer membrane protein